MIRRHAVLPSTNDEALRLARAGAGHAWVSPPGVALYFSVVLRPRVAPEALPLATLACGVAVADAVRAETGLPAGLKWPNDVLVGGRKCAGLLCEAEFGAAGAPPAVVAGIGINVNTPPEALPPRPMFPATSLAAEAGRPFDREALLAACLERLAGEMARLEAPGGAAAAAARFNERDALRGVRLRAELPDGSAAVGENLGADARGILRLRTADGVHEIVAGSLSLA